MGVWNDHVLPRVMDRVLNTATVNARRAKVCQGLQGRVLEIGFGTGLNLHHYPAEVTEILVVEPSESAMRLARSREAGTGAPIERIGRDGTQLALPDGSWIVCCPPTRCAPSQPWMSRCGRFIEC